jgi:hypothetical protein
MPTTRAVLPEATPNWRCNPDHEHEHENARLAKLDDKITALWPNATSTPQDLIWSGLPKTLKGAPPSRWVSTCF